MWEGISYVLNISKPIGERVESLQHNSAPLNMNEEYDVVMNNYRQVVGKFLYVSKQTGSKRYPHRYV